MQTRVRDERVNKYSHDCTTISFENGGSYRPAPSTGSPRLAPVSAGLKLSPATKKMSLLISPVSPQSEAVGRPAGRHTALPFPYTEWTMPPLWSFVSRDNIPGVKGVLSVSLSDNDRPSPTSPRHTATYTPLPLLISPRFTTRIEEYKREYRVSLWFSLHAGHQIRARGERESSFGYGRSRSNKRPRGSWKAREDPFVNRL